MQANRMQLTTNLSDPLLELLRDGPVPIDGVEVGPWFTVREIRAYRQMLPDLPFTFHGGDRIQNVGLIPGAVRRIAAYLCCTGSPWVSMHLTAWLPGMVWIMLRHGWRMPLPVPDRAMGRLIRQVKRLSRSLPVPVLLENIPPLPFDGYHFEAETKRITSVIERTGCGLVLDIGHARVSADRLGMDVHDYLTDLPLERVVQVHVSGVRERGGGLTDAHEPLQPADYGLLRYVLDRTHPQMVTLEYVRERDALLEQLVHLRDLLGSAS
ncbi:MAG: DUF692 family protein [Anaerolineae bacterium]|nr:DUF692 family protein [Anaerolineae bacterium]